jgi:hypothetical protein
MYEPSLLRTALGRPFYALLSVAVAAGLALLYYQMTLSAVPVAGTSEMLGPLFVAASVALTFTTAALAGVNTSLAVFKIRNSRLMAIRRGCSSTAFGGTLMAFAPGCPACATPLVALIGTTGGLALFPLQGLEFKVISLAALSFSSYWMARRHVRHDVCSAGDKKAGA